MPPVKTKGIIIYNSPLGEFDRLLEIFSPSLGRIQAVAKGARNFKNRFGGVLEPFNYCIFDLFKRNQTSFYRIEACDIIKAFVELRNDLTLIMHAWAIGDTLRKLTPLENYGDANRAIFSLLYNVLNGMASGERPERLILYYRLRLLNLIGIRPEFNRCVKCGKRFTENKISFSMSEGGIVCTFCKDKMKGPFMILKGSTVGLIRSWQSLPYRNLKKFILRRDMICEINKWFSAYTGVTLHNRILNPAL